VRGVHVSELLYVLFSKEILFLRILALSLLLTATCAGQGSEISAGGPINNPVDPAFVAIQAWEKQHTLASHSRAEWNAHSQAMLEASAEWVARWPDNRVAWEKRREALLCTQSRSSEDWKRVGEALMRLSRSPHTRVSSIAADWVAAGVLLREASDLLRSELEWVENHKPSVNESDRGTMLPILDEAMNSGRRYGLFPPLADAGIKSKDFKQAHWALNEMRRWLDTDFKKYYDQDLWQRSWCTKLLSCVVRPIWQWPKTENWTRSRCTSESSPIRVLPASLPALT
jgi:hypothetical protein